MEVDAHTQMLSDSRQCDQHLEELTDSGVHEWFLVVQRSWRYLGGIQAFKEPP
jgi:hypothetical protein